MMGSAEFKVGLFVAICMAVVAMMSLQVNNDPSLTGRAQHYDVDLPNASGLVKNSQVKMAGIPVGVIRDISLQDGKARILMYIRGNLRVTKSASVEVKPNGILGDKYLEINPGNSSDEQLPDGSVILNFKDNGSFDVVLNQVGKIAADVSEITTALKKATTGDGDDGSPVGRILHNIEDLTGDLREIADNKKDKLEETIDNIHKITQSINEFVNDDSEDGFKTNWKKMAKSLGRVDSILKNVDEITGKINTGKGTIGKLINDETTVEEINHAVSGINNMLDSASKFQLSVDYHSEIMSGPLTKSFVGLQIQPGPDRYYLIQVVDDPKGSFDHVSSLQTTNGASPTYTDTQTVYHNKLKISVEFAKTFYDLTLRAGIIENAGGAGVDYSFLNRKLKLSAEIFDFSRQEGADLRAYIKYKFYSVFYAVAGGDDILNTKGNPLTGTGASGFIGAGLDFNNDDLKLLLTKGSILMFKRALISTSDKSGLLEFIRPLADKGCEIVSTGGTSQFLKKNGLKVTEVAEATGFPEMMDGRVRTLHPKIHMGLLARSFVPEDFELLKEHGVKPFDLVVVNLYPFEEAFHKGLRGQELIEQIDIGGPSLLRAAAKSHERVTVTCDPQDYPEILKQVQAGETNLPFRKKLAQKVFQHCSYYDSLVAQALDDSSDIFDEKEKTLSLGFRKKASLRYGENPHQKASLFENLLSHPLSLLRAQQLQGKELSYNNILDLEGAVGAVGDFEEPCCVIIKHVTPCGAAIDADIGGAYKKAFEGDPISAFGGIIALNRPLDDSLAEELVKPFLECVIAPSVTASARKILAAKKNLRVLTLEDLGRFSKNKEEVEFKSIRGGLLAQTSDYKITWSDGWKVFGEKPKNDIQKDLVFAQNIVRHVRSNAIVIVQNRQTIGICGGQTNRVDSVKWALERALKIKKGDGPMVLGSDAFFPFRDSIDLAAQAGVRWVIHPGGSLRDQEVEAAAKEHGIGLVVTGTRHFKH